MIDFEKVLKIFIIFIMIICIFFIPNLAVLSKDENIIASEDFKSNYGFLWPIPNYTNISSYFGRRNRPVSGGSSYHLGLDIPAPEGSNLIAIDDGIVTFSGWGAGGGYTITYDLVSHPEIKISYCHMSPVIFFSEKDYIKKGEKLGTVGPKNVYGIVNNQYKDNNGNPTNGATTGTHLHFAIKQNGKNVNPLNFYQNE